MKTISFKYAMNYINLQYENNGSDEVHREQICFLSICIEQSTDNLYIHFSTTSITNLTKIKKNKCETGLSEGEYQYCAK